MRCLARPIVLGRRHPQFVILSLLLVCLGACMHATPPPTLQMELHSFRLSVEITPDGWADLGSQPPLDGRIDLRPILAVESVDPDTVQVLLYSSRLYLWADGFRNVWELTAEAGVGWAQFRPLAVADHPLSGLRLARYGTADAGCIRIDVPDLGARFISSTGSLEVECTIPPV